jgi:hypothetical protein
MEPTQAFYVDTSSALEVAKFPEDFADHLMDEGRDEEAREFLVICKRWEKLTPEDEQEIDELIEIASGFGPVVSFQDEIGNDEAPKVGYGEAKAFYDDWKAVDEPDMDDPFLPPDREAALINQMLRDSSPVVPMDMDEHEFEDVEVYVDDGDRIAVLMFKVFEALIENTYASAARRFIGEVDLILRRGSDPNELFELAWSYVSIVPEHGSEHQRRMMAR